MNEYAMMEPVERSEDASPLALAINHLRNMQQRVELMTDRLTKQCEPICRPDTGSPEVAQLDSVLEPRAPHVAELERVAHELDRQADRLALLLERLAV